MVHTYSLPRGLITCRKLSDNTEKPSIMYARREVSKVVTKNILGCVMELKVLEDIEHLNPE